MRKVSLILFVVVGLFVFFFFFSRYEIHITRRPPRGGLLSTSQAKWDDPRQETTLRIASFNIETFGPTKASRAEVMDILVRVVGGFDIVAIQEIRSKDQTIISQFVSMINASGAKYDYVLGPALGRSHSKEQYAFVFDTETVEVDFSATYTIADPYDRLHREPLVGLFRARGPSGDEAFTFKLVNIHVDPDDVQSELNTLDDVYRAVLQDGDGEDDVIIVGDLNTSEDKLYELGQIPDIGWALSDTPTNTRGTRSYDNFVFHRSHTSEYNGRTGVIDLVRAFNLTTEEAERISNHLPIWGEFSVYEGGGTGRVATSADADATR